MGTEAKDEILESGALTLEAARKVIRSQQTVIRSQHEQIGELRSTVDEQRTIIAELQKRNPTQCLEESYSAEAEAKRKAREPQAAARKKKEAERKGCNRRPAITKPRFLQCFGDLIVRISRLKSG